MPINIIVLKLIKEINYRQATALQHVPAAYTFCVNYALYDCAGMLFKKPLAVILIYHHLDEGIRGSVYNY